MKPNVKPISRGKRVMISLLTMLITTVVSAGLGWLISLVTPLLAQPVENLLNALSLQPTNLWSIRFWQLISFVIGFLVSVLVGLLLHPRQRRGA